MQVDGRFVMHRGGYLESPTIAYETWGELQGKGENAILLFTGLSPSAHAASSPENPAAGWWEDMIGSGLPLDTDRYFVICVNSLGSCFGSTGPADINPETGKRYCLSYPVLTLEDVADGGYEVLKHLGIEKVHTTMGASMGGMSALAFCVRHPDMSERMISISSATRALPFAIAVRSLQREMITKDRKWNNGSYDPDDPPVIGQRLARKLGMMTYRSAEEWEERFARERISFEEHADNPFYGDFAVESYLESHANKFTGQFDANSYLYLSRASDLWKLWFLKWNSCDSTASRGTILFSWRWMTSGPSSVNFLRRSITARKLEQGGRYFHRCQPLKLGDVRKRRLSTDC
jgi:homoserine O-acetyltransferase